MKTKTKSKTKTKTEKLGGTTVAAQVAGEDIELGDYVTVLNEVLQLPSFLWCCSMVPLPADELVRIRYMPCNAGQPCKVIAVCLPFVYVERPNGDVSTVDLRRSQLARLDRKRAQSVSRRMRSRRK